MIPPVERRLWAKVEKTETCWLWRGVTSQTGYGTIGVNGKNRRVHRVSWELAYGPIPDGLAVCHKCDVRNCVRPDHLFLGTQADNLADMRQKGRNPDDPAVFNRSKTHCKRGHPFAGDNLIIRSSEPGHRICRTCTRARKRRRARREATSHV